MGPHAGLRLVIFMKTIAEKKMACRRVGSIPQRRQAIFINNPTVGTLGNRNMMRCPVTHNLVNR
jgi:hypothetical protein